MSSSSVDISMKHKRRELKKRYRSHTDITLIAK
jgi:hypothetical protein